MLDLDLLRQKPEVVKDSIKKRGGKTELVDDFLKLDSEWREIIQQVEKLRGERNTLTTTKESATENRDKLQGLKTKLQELEEKTKGVSSKRSELLLSIPQVIDEDIPVGLGESANYPLRTEGDIKLKEGKSHDEIMTALGWLDLETAAKMSGARFRYLKGKAVLAHMKMMNLAVEFAVEKGFTPVIPPVILKEETLVKGGFFPFGKEDTYKVEDDYLVGTSEPMLVALGAGNTYKAEDLPLRFVGFSTCFRKEAGSYGKDTKGMFRQHQFDKVEMVSICTPDQSKGEHEFLLSMQEEFVKKFNLPYQVLMIGSGDLEAKATRKYDVECWFPSQSKYRETHSVSNCGDYQARRFGIKVEKDGQEVIAHTLNGTLATERLLLAVVENNQTEDGQVNLPGNLS